VTDKGGNPLQDMSRLLDRTGLGERYKAQDKVNVSPDIIKVIDEQIELPLMFNNLENAGTELKDAIGDIRTGFGKFADLFSRDDLKVNFSFKNYGPTFERRLVTGRGGGLVAKDVDRMRKTGYFKNQTLPTMNAGKYKFDNRLSSKADAEVTVATNGVTGIDGASIDGLTLGNTYGSALYLYLKGYLTAQEDKQQSATQAPKTPKPDDKTPEEKWNEYIEQLLDGSDWNWTMKDDYARPGGVFFEFNENKTDQMIPDNYVEKSNENINSIKFAYDKTFKDIDNKPELGIKVVVIATGDTIGTPEQNKTVSGRRAVAVARQLLTSLGPVDMKSLGEAPWASATVMQAKEKLTNQNKKDLRYARFGTSIFVRSNRADINYDDIARKFFLSVAGSQDKMGVTVTPGVTSESYRANLINEIRRIIKETK